MKLVAPKGDGKKQVAAYNLCDGQHTQAEIGAAVSLDKGSLSRTISRWVDQGIVVRVGTGGDMRPLHVYPLPQESDPKKEKKNDGK
ncbi:MarR family transcriptional regulator [Methyloceanibacter marginalis]|uniref:MarR family transcriptional regulator n=1 Tax=Methyloceanibacter marginalis TaxID=1774971 RepID=UPI001FCCF1CE|nr:helix-turn-helix domain-containing protein [Methyloceanibacter marginalis]